MPPTSPDISNMAHSRNLLAEEDFEARLQARLREQEAEEA